MFWKSFLGAVPARLFSTGVQKKPFPLLNSRGPIIFRQLFEPRSCTYTYLIADNDSKEAILIDPVLDTVHRDLKLLKELKVNLRYALNTHVHADHITGSGMLKRHLTQCKSVISSLSRASADIYIKHGEIFKFGQFELECRGTPGHTPGCITYVFHDAEAAFTGDTLLIRGCGRTDFQDGSSDQLYESVYSQIFSLPESYLLFPAHDYTGRMVTSVGEEKDFNPRLNNTKEEFKEIMGNLNLAPPKQMNVAVPINLACGIQP